MARRGRTRDDVNGDAESVWSRSSTSGVPRAAATIQRRAVCFAPNHVVRARRVDGQAEVVAVRERVAVRRLVRSPGAEVRQTDAHGPLPAVVRRAGEPCIPAAKPATVPARRISIVLPCQAKVPRGWTGHDRREVTVSLVVDANWTAPL